MTLARATRDAVAGAASTGIAAGARSHRHRRRRPSSASLALCLRASAVAACLLARPARAQVTGEPVAPLPDPTRFAIGLYTEAEAGAVLFLGDAATALGPGFSIGARVGYDFLRWLALQVHAQGSSHVTRGGASPGGGQLLQVYQGTLELKFGARFGRWSVAALGGAGLARLSTNLLGTRGLTDPGIQSSPLFLGGLVLDYHLLARHVSFGLSGDFLWYQTMHAPGAVDMAAYVRYTF